jgi:hypothetical protein
MRTIRTFLIGVTMFAPAVCHGQTKCPWMNEATARGILGGAVTAAATVSASGAGVCTFSRRQGAAVHQLSISVEIMTDVSKQFPTYLAQCAANGTQLRAIGNEAVICTMRSKEELPIERVVGRVREQAFVVSVSSKEHADPSVTQEMRRHQVNLAAELVAGILF